MAKITSACEWCGKSIYFVSEEKDQKGWWFCDNCNAKKSDVEMNDCYGEIKDSLQNGKWVIGKRIIHSMGSEISEYVIFTFASKKYIRATRSRESIQQALDDLFSTVWDAEEIKQFGFTFLKEMDPITDIKMYHK